MAKSSKEASGSKRAVLPIMMMMSYHYHYHHHRLYQFLFIGSIKSSGSASDVITLRTVE
jgi:hypothetical protein